MPDSTGTTDPDEAEIIEGDSPTSEPDEGSEAEVLDLVGALLAA